MTHMPIKFARRVDLGSACVDIRQSPKTDVLVANVTCRLFAGIPTIIMEGPVLGNYEITLYHSTSTPDDSYRRWSCRATW